MSLLPFALAALAPRAPRAPRAQPTADRQCPRGALPAYAHNDYLNPQPLAGALALGYKGVEADVFLVEGRLQLGHERRAAERAGRFETLYLQPLRTLVAHCGTLTADGQPFLLTLEIKESSRPTFDTLVALLARYPDLFARDSAAAAAAGNGAPPVRAVLVGWYPPGFADSVPIPLSRQARLERAGRPPHDAADPSVGLIGLDYQETMGRWYRTPAQRRQWLSGIRATRAAFPALRIRAYHVPVKEDVYRDLLGAGVDLIGTQDLAESARLLNRFAAAQRR
ncbi:MAG TPA: hypothetical protein VH277_05265 [Gemmatimonadaceae bacterium]|jgi:hypothetical protein|nr:hypothetical protein [Gemmatimonadaceae bacterium]